MNTIEAIKANYTVAFEAVKALLEAGRTLDDYELTTDEETVLCIEHNFEEYFDYLDLDEEENVGKATSFIDAYANIEGVEELKTVELPKVEMLPKADLSDLAKHIEEVKDALSLKLKSLDLPDGVSFANDLETDTIDAIGSDSYYSEHAWNNSVAYDIRSISLYLKAGTEKVFFNFDYSKCEHTDEYNSEMQARTLNQVSATNWQELNELVDAMKKLIEDAGQELAGQELAEQLKTVTEAPQLNKYRYTVNYMEGTTQATFSSGFVFAEDEIDATKKAGEFCCPTMSLSVWKTLED